MSTRSVCAPGGAAVSPGRRPVRPSPRGRPMPRSWRSGSDGPAPATGRSSSELEPRRQARGTRGRPRLDEHRFAGVLSLTPHGGARRRDVVVAFGAAATDGVTGGSLERLVGHWVPRRARRGGRTAPTAPERAARANHHLRALGPRPVDPEEHELWVGAARAIDAYRDRWGLHRSPESLGHPAPAELASMPAARLADLVRTTRHLDAVRARLGHREPVGVELGLGR